MSNAISLGWACTTGISNIISIKQPLKESGIIYQITSSIDSDKFHYPGYNNNGDFVVVNTPHISYYNASRALVWNRSSYYPDHDFLLASYFSSIDDMFYVISHRSSTQEIVLSSLDKTNGVITNLTTPIYFSSFEELSCYYYGLSQLDNGNLIFVTTKINNLGAIIEFTNTGTVVSNTNLEQNGINLLKAVDNSDDIPITYQTKDKTILSGIRNMTGNNILYIARNGAFRIIVNTFPEITNGRFLGMWNGYICVLDAFFINTNGARFFNRNDFDRWLSDICDSVGI